MYGRGLGCTDWVGEGHGDPRVCVHSLPDPSGLLTGLGGTA